MKKYFVRLLIFVLLCFGLDRSLYFVLKQPSKHFDWRYGKVREEQLSTDILLVGSSRGVRGLSAEVIEVISGKNTFNFCYPGSSLPFHLYCLETFLNNQIKRPKIVVLNLDDDFAFKENPWLSFRTNMLYGHTKYEDVNDLLIAYGENHPLAAYFNILKIRAIHLGIGQQKPLATDFISSKGSMPLFKKNELCVFSTFVNDTTSYQSDAELPGYLAAYQSIQNLCAQNHIQLIVCIPPHYGPIKQSFVERVKTLTAPEHQILLPDTNQRAYLDSNYYYDPSHLHANGARIYSREVALQINKYFQLKD
jgi:hypothetical protein